MSFRLDARIPVLTGPSAYGEPAAWLVENGQAAPQDAVVIEQFTATPAAHPVGCVCCVPRGPVAEALRRLFLARAKGAYFAVVRAAVSAAGEAALRDAVARDPLVASWYRMG